MNVRPSLRRGDLVKLARPHDKGVMYQVLDFEADPYETSRVMGFRTARRWKQSHRHILNNTHEGFIFVIVVDSQGQHFKFRRRELWRIPNQPRYGGRR